MPYLRLRQGIPPLQLQTIEVHISVRDEPFICSLLEQLLRNISLRSWHLSVVFTTEHLAIIVISQKTF